MKPSGIGGMAVIEGVMMKNKEQYAVAVRKPNNEIVVEKNTHKDFSDKAKLFKLPIFRGMLAFVDSLVIGVKVLNFSSSFFEDEEEDQDKKKKKNKKNKDKDFDIEELPITENTEEIVDIKEETKKDSKDDQENAMLMAGAVVLSIILSVALFMVLPVLITNLFTKLITNNLLISLIEGMIRLAIFIGYVYLASFMPEIKRVFMYHGAEHKSINCLEHGYELTVENVRKQSRQHKRCGTSFMLLVMIISLIFFIFIPAGTLLWRVISRVVLVPLIAGVSYEFIRLAGRSESKVVNILSQPGLWLQGLTTKEPDDTMIEVAIYSVNAVFDWKDFLKDATFNGKNDNKSGKHTKSIKDNSNKKVGKSETNQKKNESLKKTSSKSEDTSQKKAASKPEDGKGNKNNTDTQTNKTDKVKKVNFKDSNNNKDQKNSKNSSSKTNEAVHNTGKKDLKGKTAAAEPVKPAKAKTVEEEDDEILKALDKYLDFDEKDVSGAENKR